MGCNGEQEHPGFREPPNSHRRPELLHFETGSRHVAHAGLNIHILAMASPVAGEAQVFVTYISGMVHILSLESTSGVPNGTSHSGFPFFVIQTNELSLGLSPRVVLPCGIASAKPWFSTFVLRFQQTRSARLTITN